MNENDMENFRFENLSYGNLSNTAYTDTSPSMASPPGQRRSRVSEPARTTEIKGKDGGTLAAGRATHCGHVCSEVPYKERYLTLQAGSWG
jgi:hypothetical protein